VLLVTGWSARVADLLLSLDCPDRRPGSSRPVGAYPAARCRRSPPQGSPSPASRSVTHRQCRQAERAAHLDLGGDGVRFRVEHGDVLGSAVRHMDSTRIRARLLRSDPRRPERWWRRWWSPRCSWNRGQPRRPSVHPAGKRRCPGRRHPMAQLRSGSLLHSLAVHLMARCPGNGGCRRGYG
jgi:hypothetical protein